MRITLGSRCGGDPSSEERDVKWIRAFTAGPGVPALVRELGSHKLLVSGQKRKKLQKKLHSFLYLSNI